MKYIIKFTKEMSITPWTFFNSIGVKDCISQGNGLSALWTAEMDGEQLVILILKFPDAEIYRPLRKE